MQPFYRKEISIEKLETALKRIKERIYQKKAGLKIEYAATKEPVDFSERLKLQYKSCDIGGQWGELFDCAWFHFTGRVPLSCKGKKVVLIIDINGEGCVYDSKGVPVRGLTNISAEFERSLGLPGKRVLQFAEKATGDEIVDIWVDAGCNDLLGKFHGGTVLQAEIAECDNALRDLYYDYWVLLDLLKVLNKDTARYCSVLYALNGVAEMLYNLDEREVAAGRQILSKELNKKTGDTGLQFYATGHAHLDLAWLWPVRETKRKATRTFSTALEMLARYPYYIFGASQPQQFVWIKESHPELYKKIKKKVEEGRIELQGAMWTEPDLNVSGGEALVRQILYGKSYFKQEFNQDINIAHLPDVFGFNGALPQILRKSGIDYLLTIKMSWNKYNPFPYHTFNWKGIDGSDVLVHMPPEGTYNSAMAPRSVDFAEKNYIDKGKCGEALILYGIGDGGGGPGSEHLERLKRITDLNGISKVKSSTTKEFFDAVNKTKDLYQTYSGEMYLEKHQGTYTTQAKNKYYNRKLEFLLRDAEYFSTLAWKTYGAGYPEEKFGQIWREVLLYQFHDILPGSSIKRVYDESVDRYKHLEKETFSILHDALKLSQQGFYNANSFERKEWIYSGKKWFFESIGAYECADLKNEISNFKTFADKKILESASLKAEFNENGELTGLYDKVNARQVLAAASNILNIYEDNGDAWDMEEGYLAKLRDKFHVKTVNTYTEGPYAVREQTLVYGSSIVKQIIKIDDYNTSVTFENEVDWHESFKFLKAEFSPAVFTDFANCNIQFGNIKRTTKSNLPTECAQDEICCHKYIDLSEGDYGVALLNDSKYGHRVKSNVVQLSLLRSTDYPGKDADKGNHTFKYALYSHNGAFENSDVAEKAYAFNTSLYNSANGKLFDFSSKSCIVETVKKAENGNGIIVRIYEAKGLNSRFKISPQFENGKIYVAGLTENILHEANSESFEIKPFEIITLLIE